MVFWKNLFFIGLSVLAAVLFSALTSIGIFSREFFGMVLMLFLLCHVARIISSLKTDRKNPVPGKSDSQKTISESSDSLWKSADRYRSLVNNMGEGVGVVDPDECFLYVNPMAEEFFGVPAEKMIGRSLKEFVDPKEYEIILTQMELRKKGKQSRYELKINRPEGGVRYLQVTASPEFDSKGNMVDVLGIFHDITWRKHKETELQVLQEINDAINSGTPLDDVLQIITLKIRELFNFKTCNVYLVEKDKQSLRYAALAIDSKILERIEQITGITVRNLTIPLFEGSLLKKIIDERKTSVLYDMEHVVSDFSDIKKLKVLAQEVTKIVGLKTGIRVPLIAGDDVFGVIGAGMNRSVVDDTDIKSLERFASHAALIIKKARAEEEVRESEKKFRNFMDTAGDLMFIADADRNFTYVNQSMAATLGYSANEMMGMNVTKILTEESIKKSLDNEKKIEELIKTGMLADKNTWITKDNKVIFGEVKLLAILNANHNLQEVRGVFRDYTEKKSLEEQLRQSHKLEGIGQLAGGIAHDFNNILTVINGFAEMSATELDDNSDVAQFIKQIVKSSKKAEILVRQLLAFSRKQIMRPRVLNINKNIAELQKMLRRMIGEDIEIKINPAKKIPFIKADPAQIEQIIINLFINARDAVNANELLSNGKKITLETSGVILDKSFVREHVGSSAGPYIRISVSDNGCGMEKSVREQMFEPFFTTKEVGKGTGLGLSTVYGIVKQNNGYIHADSQPGKGSSFYIYWPVLEGPPATEKKSKLKKRFKGGDENILFVEDDAQLREMALKMLRSFGYSVYDAANGEEALLLVGKNGLNIDLLITDLIMPKMNGKELASLLKKIMPNVKILYCSGYTDQQIVQNGTLEEDVNFLPKPFKREVLADKIRIVLDN